MFRTVKPPPKVNPMVYVSSPSPAKRTEQHQDLEFEAAVRAEMEKLEQELRVGSFGSLASDAGHNAAYEDSSYESPPRSEPQRRAKGGGISNLYGPTDDRQNMKAANAAAYSHQVNAISQ